MLCSILIGTPFFKALGCIATVPSEGSKKPLYIVQVNIYNSKEPTNQKRNELRLAIPTEKSPADSSLTAH
jgi:hypothetical protein